MFPCVPADNTPLMFSLLFKVYSLNLNTLFALLLSLSLIQSAIAQENKPTQISFGVVPQQTASDLATTWGPFLQYLSQKTGYSFRFQASRDMPTFEKRLNVGEFDMAFMNPFQYIIGHDHQYNVFAKEKDRKLKGIIVVRADSPFKTLQELSNATIAFPGPTAFAATLLPMAQLAKIGVAFKPTYVASHDSVYLTVAKGIYPAGGGVERTLEKVAPNIRAQLRILWTTQAFTPHAIAAHSRLPASTVEKIANVMFTMDQNPKGQELLASLNFKGITSAQDKEYQDVRAIGDILKEISSHLP